MLQTKRILSAALIVLAIALGALASSAMRRATLQPRLEVSPLIGLGELTHDRELTLTIGFQNRGDGVLKVAPPIPGCACALGELSKSELLPGEAATFSFTLQPAGPPGANYFQEVIVPSNDPIGPRRVVAIQGRMRNGLVSLPAAVRVAGWRPGTAWMGVVTITAAAPTPFELTESKCSLDGLTILGIERHQDLEVEGCSAFDVHVLFEGREPGDWTGELTVQADRSDLSPVSVPVSVAVESALKVVPRSALLNDADSVSAAEVRIDAPRPVALKVRENESAAALLDVTIDAEADQTSWRARMALREEAVIDTVIKANVTIDVEGLPGERSVRIPVTILPRHDALVQSAP